MSEGIWVPPGGSADPGRQREQQQQQRPSEQELAEQLREELQRLKVSDLLIQTLYTVSSLGYHKLGPEQRDLDQARLAIDSLRALLPVLKDAISDEVHRDFTQVVSNMQLAYADAVAVAQSEPKPEAPKAEEPKAGKADSRPAESEARPDAEDLEPVDEEELGGGD